MSHEVEDIARVCHEANRALQVLAGDPYTSPPWDEAEKWQRDSAVNGVREALEGATPERLHEVWIYHKMTDGWTYGPVKDPDRKTHPCLVPYADLPENQKIKDSVFQSIVEVMS